MVSTSWAPVDRVVLLQLAVEVEGRHALVAVEGDLAAVVDELAVVAETDLLEGLLGERVPRDVGADEAGHVGGVESLRGRQHVVVRLGGAQPRLVEEVLAVDQQLHPRLAGHGQLVLAVRGELEGAVVERAAVEVVDHGADGVGVDELVGGQGADLAQRETADHVRQLPGRRVRGEDLVELVLGDRDQLDLDPGLLGEGVHDVLGGRDAVGEVLLDPDGERCCRRHRLRRPHPRRTRRARRARRSRALRLRRRDVGSE